MLDHIFIERLEFRGRCGVTPAERAKPQPMAIDLELQCELGPAGFSDNLSHTIDYAAVIARVVQVASTQESSLLEAMADRLLTMLFDEFPLEKVALWIRKLHPPITSVTSSVGVKINRARLEHKITQPPSPPARFLLQQLHRLPKGKALDIAAGRGRHSLLLASHGFQIDAIDCDESALAHLSTSAQGHAATAITTRVLDLEQPTPYEPDLGKDVYDVILVFFYLHRPLFPAILAALKPGGVLAYETFTLDNHVYHQHPKRQAFCLSPNELLRLTSSLHVLHYDEGSHVGENGTDHVYTAQLLAYKPIPSGAPI
jgi:FolB domain-containing protein